MTIRRKPKNHSLVSRKMAPLACTTAPTAPSSTWSKTRADSLRLLGPSDGSSPSRLWWWIRKTRIGLCLCRVGHSDVGGPGAHCLFKGTGVHDVIVKEEEQQQNLLPN